MIKACIPLLFRWTEPSARLQREKRQPKITGGSYEVSQIGARQDVPDLADFPPGM
ncbi:hypothetical protein [Salibacterium qingdaonense]|uniref:hypothetical protein n=1 Tax=Salibacterium qingdaonense TaxID=266892 RepID=UPI0015A6B4CB|nr:hypothetical protein [Salibacterium qingdaonense]